MSGSGELAVEIDGFMATLMNEIFRDLKIILWQNFTFQEGKNTFLSNFNNFSNKALFLKIQIMLHLLQL